MDVPLSFFPGIVFYSRVNGACSVTKDLIMRVNVRTTTTTHFYLEYAVVSTNFMASCNTSSWSLKVLMYRCCCWQLLPPAPRALESRELWYDTPDGCFPIITFSFAFYNMRTAYITVVCDSTLTCTPVFDEKLLEIRGGVRFAALKGLTFQRKISSKKSE